MYEPSKELIEQIAKEYCLLVMSKAAIKYEIPSQETVDISKMASVDLFLYCPTIRKALEQMENQPQWQDKPDKEGWWWVCSEEPASGAKFNQIVEIRGIPAGLRVWVGGFPTIEQYIGEYVRGTKITWLYIPEPEPYKGEE